MPHRRAAPRGRAPEGDLAALFRSRVEHWAPHLGVTFRRVRVKDVGDTNFLVDEQVEKHLFEKENEGVLVSEVKAGSIAEKSGLKEHDILVTLEGKSITDRWQFRADVLTSLGKPEFDVELLRAGKRLTVKVKTSARKDE